MKKLIYASVLSAFILSGCSTIYFHRTGMTGDNPEYSNWHHGGVARLVEFSSPVDLSLACEGKGWDTIRTERQFLHGLAASVSYGLYDPWDVSLSCKK